MKKCESDAGPVAIDELAELRLVVGGREVPDIHIRCHPDPTPTEKEGAESGRRNPFEEFSNNWDLYQPLHPAGWEKAPQPPCPEIRTVKKKAILGRPPPHQKA